MSFVTNIRFYVPILIQFCNEINNYWFQLLKKEISLHKNMDYWFYLLQFSTTSDKFKYIHILSLFGSCNFIINLFYINKISSALKFQKTTHLHNCNIQTSTSEWGNVFHTIWSSLPSDIKRTIKSSNTTTKLMLCIP